MSRNTKTQPNRTRSGKIAIAASLGIVAVVAAIVVANPKQPAQAPAAPSASAIPVRAGALSAAHGAYNFGSISMAAGKVRHRYAFTNASASPVMIERIFTSCMCTTATFIKGPRVIGTYGMPGHTALSPVNTTLAPGETGLIEATFDPAAHGPAGLGRTEREITIEQSGAQPLVLAFTADVRP